ncbi:peptidylprolyl isomerase [Labilibaculum sp.]|uniref:peptidylprolyl isomerase n=1 Tax=Labilibaculum sp. TaxID=2060723 RepID=UPI002AA7306E|nr:peptidylprolyl isomerase [Labilibaculum sp.]
MKRVFFYLSIILCCQMASFGQSHPTDTLFTINNTPFSSQEFKELYQANNQLSIEEALDLYILFQVKLAEAKKLKIDTLPEVKHELQINRDIALNSFLYPTVITEEKTQEAFNRIQYFLRARHILVKISKRANDTLPAYQKAQEIYLELLQGKSFEKTARKKSDDQSVKENHGELGYFTAFDMEYRFESAAYKLEIGEFSKPIRTKFGYHIIQILEKIPNPGKVKIRHILLDYQPENESEIKQKIDSLYTILMKGADFAQLAKNYSEDKRSAPSGGILPWFGLFETHPKIEKTAFQLKEIGEISKPVKTNFGYHILQLTDKKNYSSLDDCREEIQRLIASDSRSKLSTEELIAKIKKDYQFKENRELLSNFYSILDYAYADLWEPLFTIDGKEYTQEDFANYLSQQASKDIYENFIEYINRIYDNFSNNSILAFYKNQLLENNNDLINLIQNFENRVLVLGITKQKVWLPAKHNNKGLMEFYQNQINRYNNNVDFESIKQEVASDYKLYLKEVWENQLRKNYKIEISQSTLNKIVQQQND